MDSEEPSGLIYSFDKNTETDVLPKRCIGNICQHRIGYNVGGVIGGNPVLIVGEVDHHAFCI